jgi:radical SAM superfamily enzyme YgiQ (UPF0313 family)
MKTYYEDNGKNSNIWKFHDPEIGDLSDDDITKILISNPPNVIGFSVYVWNETRFDNLAKRIKKLFPECVIVYGGPQQNVRHNLNYFKDKPWVDITLPADAYGEIVLKEILDNFPIEDFESIPYIYYTDKEKNRYFSSKGIEKRSFNWPSKIFRRQEKFLLPKILEKKSKNIEIGVMYETSRGCPYRCIYCEWGGGINTKVVKRPYSDVLDDIEWLSSIGMTNYISICDANFGIMDIDIEIAKFIVECKKKYNYPEMLDFDWAKNNYKNVLSIRDILLEERLMAFHTISFQTMNEEAKKNIERIDIPFEKQVEGIKYLENKHGYLPVYLEQILGLPGETLETFCKQVDKIYEHGIEIGVSKPVPWVLLPEAPAYSKEMREKFKIKTVFKHVDLNPKLKPDREYNQHRNEINLKLNWSNSNLETVIETYSYTSDDWMKMRRFFSLVVAGHATGLNKFLISYMNRVHHALPSEIYKEIDSYQFKDEKISKWFEDDLNQTNKWLNDPTIENICVDLGDHFPFMVPQHIQIAHIIFFNSKNFYYEIGSLLSNKWKDPLILDLCIWISNILIDYHYDKTVGRSFVSNYNWLEYFENNEPLIESKCLYRISSTEINIHNNSKTEIEWSNTDNAHESEVTFYTQISSHIRIVHTFDSISRVN